MIYVDADACPVKDEVYRVATRLSVAVTVVANTRMRVPANRIRVPANRMRLPANVEAVVVGSALDAADDWIAARTGPGDVVITADILLAARCIASGAKVVPPDGRPLDAESIGDAVATRALMADLREQGLAGGGPAPFSPKDRSRFLHALDRALRP